MILGLSLACASTLIINLTKESFNARDGQELKIAQKRCGEIYKDAPCLKRFVKARHLIYRAICTSEEKNEPK